MKEQIFIATLLLTISTSLFSKQVYFIEPKDGQEVQSPVKIKFGLIGMGIAPAGVDVENTGHHHLLVDAESLPNLDLPIPSSKNHIHFGGGQTETTIFLTQGVHSLQLLLGDKYHIPHKPALFSTKIQIKVIEP